MHSNPINDLDHTGNGLADEFRKSVFDTYINGSFNIIRLRWKRGSGKHPARIDDNWSNGYQQGAITTGCYIKLISGDFDTRSVMKPIINFENGWKLYGMRQSIDSIYHAFHSEHSKLALSSKPGDSGEMLICLFGSVSGFFPYEELTWGIFPEFAHV
ncbi:hypothetical protein [Zooshikella ganghwensis]|uniref:hypothetical protein n=1 Tax=Zooshikella ganghwensis TaxID=202772 RepID=UPI000683E639|nr:hypothetical protein [Zooshikella ganghwensis]